MKKIFLLTFLSGCVLLSNTAHAQGCIAIRNIVNGTSVSANQPNTWQFSASYRFFKSYKHFVGNEEQVHRVQQSTNVINHDNSLTLGANYTLNNHWNFSIAVPLLYIDRSSLYEHLGNSSGQRFYSSSKGLGDIRLAADYVLVNNSKNRLMVGSGLKLPTGDYKYTDIFHRRDANGNEILQERFVDQSIQPGDGGTAFTLQYDYVHMAGTHFQIYSTAQYLFNPRNTNGVQRSSNAGTIPLSNEFSVVDQYFARVGGQYQLGLFTAGLGGRIEGIPAFDMIGKSDGFRRPGYIISLEPTLFYSTGNHIIGLSVPVALERNRTQSAIDKQRQIETGQLVHGDAAFADYLISVSYAYRLSKLNNVF